MVVLDDVSVWISNIIALKMNVYCEVDRILSVLSSIKHKLVVSKELGLGIIPNSPLVLKYTNLVSCVNQVFARTLNSVYFVIASNAIKIK
ncbi:MAG: bifunctional adenosylcobinamide kinase/adenosylcobinamide-phosphate guanylyltransferase [Candidatus Hodgkinia cicadicola]